MEQGGMQCCISKRSLKPESELTADVDGSLINWGWGALKSTTLMQLYLKQSVRDISALLYYWQDTFSPDMRKSSPVIEVVYVLWRWAALLGGWMSFTWLLHICGLRSLESLGSIRSPSLSCMQRFLSGLWVFSEPNVQLANPEHPQPTAANSVWRAVSFPQRCRLEFVDHKWGSIHQRLR